VSIFGLILPSLSYSTELIKTGSMNSYC